MSHGAEVALGRYYYAVATFDSPAAAAHVVQEIDGTEFERTANVFDLQCAEQSDRNSVL